MHVCGVEFGGGLYGAFRTQRRIGTLSAISWSSELKLSVWSEEERGFQREPPEQLSIRGIEPDERLRREADELPHSRHRGDDPIRRDPTNAAVPVIRDEQVACAVYSHAAWVAQLRAGGSSAIAGVTRPGVSRHSRKYPARIQLENRAESRAGVSKCSRIE